MTNRPSTGDAARYLAVKSQAGLYEYERDLIRHVRYENWVNPAPAAAA